MGLPAGLPVAYWYLGLPRVSASNRQGAEACLVGTNPSPSSKREVPLAPPEDRMDGTNRAPSSRSHLQLDPEAHLIDTSRAGAT